MALRAGYYGLKRKFARLINSENIIPADAGSDNPLVSEYWFKKTVNYDYKTGVKNILRAPAPGTYSDHGVTFVVQNDGSVIVSGTASGTAILRWDIVLPAGSYVLYGRYSNNVWCGLYNYTANQYWVTTQSGEPGMLNLQTDQTRVGMTVRVGDGTALSTPIIMKPMLCYNALPVSDNTYYPYARTNADLTADIDGMSVVDMTGKETIAGVYVDTNGTREAIYKKSFTGTITGITDKTVGTVSVGEISNLKRMITVSGYCYGNFISSSWISGTTDYFIRAMMDGSTLKIQTNRDAHNDKSYYLTAYYLKSDGAPKSAGSIDTDPDNAEPVKKTTTKKTTKKEDS